MILLDLCHNSKRDSYYYSALASLSLVSQPLSDTPMTSHRNRNVSAHVSFKECGMLAYPWRFGLQSAQVIFQSQAPAAVEQRLHSSHVCFHQLLPLPGRLLLQSLHHLLEVLRIGHILPMKKSL